LTRPAFSASPLCHTGSPPRRHHWSPQNNGQFRGRNHHAAGVFAHITGDVLQLHRHVPGLGIIAQKPLQRLFLTIHRSPPREERENFDASDFLIVSLSLPSSGHLDDKCSQTQSQGHDRRQEEAASFHRFSFLVQGRERCKERESDESCSPNDAPDLDHVVPADDWASNDIEDQ